MDTSALEDCAFTTSIVAFTAIRQPRNDFCFLSVVSWGRGRTRDWIYHWSARVWGLLYNGEGNVGFYLCYPQDVLGTIFGRRDLVWDEAYIERLHMIDMGDRKVWFIQWTRARPQWMDVKLESGRVF
jgi:hypothetical protein